MLHPHPVILMLLLLLASLAGQAQIRVQVQDQATNESLPFATLVNVQTGDAYVSDQQGWAELPGTGMVAVSYTGFQEDTFQIRNDGQVIGLNPDAMTFDAVVVSGTRTFKRQTRTPVIVSLISRQTLDQVQACTMADGLRFQPGLRVETDCQTCNYTQLRMNGLAGGYSQILINGRPIFSPLTGLYGMEQLPVNMIERIEVVRGGGSVLYGSGAIGGTINVITRLPSSSGFDLGSTWQSIGGQAADRRTAGNATVLNEAGTLGAAFFFNHQQREAYDHNGDQFSELPAIRNLSFGTHLTFQPAPGQKLEVSLSRLHEYRYGGELTDLPPHLAAQSEERTHDVLLGSADYQIDLNQGRTSLITYLGGQHTDREHYTGILPDDPDERLIHLANPPYGSSDNTTLQGGVQVNHRWTTFPGVAHTGTAGIEFVQDDVLDVINAYQYRIDQVSRNTGMFAQSDWQITPALSALSGIRMDIHNLVDGPVFSPRISLLYRWKETTQFRLTYGRGFRAPQAFDTDLHIAFAGGAVPRVQLDPALREERSQSISTSVNVDHATDHWIAGFTLEGFYTRLYNAFFLDPVGVDAFGQQFLKRNGPASTVQGLILEGRANYDQKVQLEAGMTWQTSLFDQAVTVIDGLPARKEFLRTPNAYGFANLSLFPLGRWTTSANAIFTGPMTLAHFAGAPEQEADAFVTSPTFVEISIRTAYTLPVDEKGLSLQLILGVRNLTNAYQDDFDTGKNRDSNYVYGPGMPRSIYGGVKLNFSGNSKSQIRGTN